MVLYFLAQNNLPRRVALMVRVVFDNCFFQSPFISRILGPATFRVIVTSSDNVIIISCFPSICRLHRLTSFYRGYLAGRIDMPPLMLVQIIFGAKMTRYWSTKRYVRASPMNMKHIYYCVVLSIVCEFTFFGFHRNHIHGQSISQRIHLLENNHIYQQRDEVYLPELSLSLSPTPP